MERACNSALLRHENGLIGLPYTVRGRAFGRGSCRPTADQHLIPGRGTVDWPGVRDALREIGYRGVLMLEIRPSSMDEIREAYEFVVGVMRG